MKWSKRCNLCNGEQYYTTKFSLKAAIKNNSSCKSCANSGENNPNYEKICSEETRQKMSVANAGENHPFYGKHHTNKSKQKMRENSPNVVGIHNPFYGKSHSKKSLYNMSLSKLGKNNPMYSKMTGENNPTKRPEVREKMRLAAIRRIENGNGSINPNYNPTACKIIDEYGAKHGYNFQHAENGGEFNVPNTRYFVDGYDRNKNVVIEYYETAHDKTKEHDDIRKQKIIEHLGCEFIILKEFQ